MLSGIGGGGVLTRFTGGLRVNRVGGRGASALGGQFGAGGGHAWGGRQRPGGTPAADECYPPVDGPPDDGDDGRRGGQQDAVRSQQTGQAGAPEVAGRAGSGVGLGGGGHGRPALSPVGARPN